MHLTVTALESYWIDNLFPNPKNISIIDLDINWFGILAASKLLICEPIFNFKGYDKVNFYNLGIYWAH